MKTFTQHVKGGRVRVVDGFDTSNTLVLAFGDRATLENPTFFSSLSSAFPTAVLAGCSTAGHFIDDSLFDEEPTIVGLRFESSTLQQATVALDSVASSRDAGEKLGRELQRSDLKAVFVVSDGTHCNGTALVNGLIAALPANTVIFGGLAADGEDFTKTLVLDSFAAAPERVTAVGISGQHLNIRTGSGGGWELFGPERSITAANGSVLHTLDGESALEIYKRYLGDLADDLPGSALLFPMAIRPADSADGDHLIRSVLSVDHDADSMTFAGELPVGWRAQLMRASFDGLVDGAADSAELATAGHSSADESICIGISCIGRRLVLGSRCEDELDAVVDVLSPETSLVGYYSYGELAPGQDGGCELHNQTMTLAHISERDDR